MTEQTLVAIVDDDESVRESLPDLLRSFGLAVEAFSSAENFLAFAGLERIGCLVLDVAMPGMSGPDLQRELARAGRDIPIVFITAQPDKRLQSAVLEAGAVDYLTKPFTEDAVLGAVRSALART